MIHEELYAFDDALRNEYSPLAGVDEAGRGPLCGPVSVAAVILDPADRFDWLTDSKKISEKRREELYEEITQKALRWKCVLIDNETIDRINILAATLDGMKQVAEEMKVGERGLVIIDGNKCPKLEVKCDFVIKGDATSASIAAASVIAKVTRDRFMRELAKQYPEYGFDVHKGYGTKAHYEAIKRYGLTPYHRKSFLKNLDTK